MYALSKKIIAFCEKRRWFSGDAYNHTGYSDYQKHCNLDDFEYPKISRPDITAAERELNVKFPAVLQNLYLEVANGHYGPGYGLYGLPARRKKRLRLSMIREHKERSKYWWPKGLVPLCYFGCTVISALYVPDGRVVMYDYSNIDCDYVYLADTSLDKWLSAWISGKDMFNRVQNKSLAEFP